jgi:hypothetical protein
VLLYAVCRYDTRLTARGQTEAARAAVQVARLSQQPEVRTIWHYSRCCTQWLQFSLAMYCRYSSVERTQLRVPGIGVLCELLWFLCILLWPAVCSCWWCRRSRVPCKPPHLRTGSSRPVLCLWNLCGGSGCICHLMWADTQSSCSKSTHSK